jgi:hypothetical protein
LSSGDIVEIWSIHEANHRRVIYFDGKETYSDVFVSEEIMKKELDSIKKTLLFIDSRKNKVL